MREIRTLRARRRGLETELRIIPGGHEGGNPGHRQGRSCGQPRQSSTLPPGSPRSKPHLREVAQLIALEVAETLRLLFAREPTSDF